VEYRLKIKEEIVPVQVTAGPEDTLKIAMAEKQFDVAYQVIGDHMIHMRVNGRSVNAYLTADDGGRNIAINGLTCRVEDADLLEQNRGRKKTAGDVPLEVTPPMPAVVVRVMVDIGDNVTKGQGVVVVAAMKMETTLNAPFGGTVTGVNTAAGDKVMPGEILVNIEEVKSEK
jgi:acetyl/propionyl-CoA carboxylase alpha subunit